MRLDIGCYITACSCLIAFTSVNYFVNLIKSYRELFLKYSCYPSHCKIIQSIKMDDVFKYITPITYGLIVTIWLYILVFFTKKIKHNEDHDKLLNLLLYILIINAVSTILSNLYFGLRQSSHVGIFPVDVYHVLIKPQYVFLPKFLTLVSGILIFLIVVHKWLPTELKQRIAIKDLIIRKNSELLKKNKELRIAKDRAEESDKLKTEFLNNMSHEVRTPMNAIIGFSELLDSPDITREERKNYLSIMQNSGYQLLRIIEDILEISNLETQQESLKEKQFNLNDFMMELFCVFNLKHNDKDIEFTINNELDDGASYIITDRTRLNKVLSNLLENAFRYTMEGSIEMGYRISGETITFYVKDTGIGISKENQKVVFKRFSQEEKELSRKYGGLGLGLAISRENAKLLGGDITLESQKGKGSTFFVTIPYKAVQKPEEELTSTIIDAVIQGNKTNCSVLVAEDEDVNFLYIKTILHNKKDVNYSILHARNGKEAVDMCMKNKDIDIVLMDIKMPVMNGYEATKRIKSVYPSLPIIAQTAYFAKGDRDLAYQHGCNDFISKPIDKDKLFGMINKYLVVR